VFKGLQASIEEAFGTTDVSKFSYAVQGAGQTGYYLINYLIEHGAKRICFTELNPAHVERMKKEHPEVKFVKAPDIYSQDVDVFCPCALGGLLDEKTIPKIKAKVIAGSANNILKDEKAHGDLIMKLNKVYAPDFIINAGGVINVYDELLGYDKNRAMRNVELIYDRLRQIYAIAKKKHINTQMAAIHFAQERIRGIGEVRKNFIPRCHHHK
jgi:leucine dehydrogenase